MKKNNDVQVVFWFLFFGIAIFLLSTYAPPFLSDAYKGSGAVIGMVNPNGVDPVRDKAYVDVNQGNARANEINSYAYQRVSITQLLWPIVFGVIAVMVLTLRLLIVRNQN